MTNEIKPYDFERIGLFDTMPISLVLNHLQRQTIVYGDYRISVEISKKQLPCYPNSVLTRIRIIKPNNQKQTTSSRAIITCISELEIVVKGLVDFIKDKPLGVENVAKL